MSSNLTFSNLTSERYACALYELAQESSELDQTENEMKNLKELLNTSNDFKNMVMNPTIGKNEQSRAISKISEYLDFSKNFKKFLNLLTFKRRLFFLDKIIDNFLKLTSKNKGEVTAKLISSKELSKNEVDLMQKNLSKYLNKEIRVEYTHDSNLIGGFIIQVGSMMFDTSIKNKLKRLENLMMES